ncbi:MAG: cytochrome c3 family protein [Chloroflexi bacterium]|nr:cytochrome c3 family protein [Chloroflexota bacterium]
MPKALTGLIIASIAGLVLLGAVVYLVGSAWFGLPVGAQGPDQPIAFPHTVHAGSVESGGIGLDCTFCHRNVDKGAAATVPAVQQCMFCHSKVGGTTEAAQLQITKLRNYYESDTAINWVRVHRLPDHVQFVHDLHINYLMENPARIVNSVPEIGSDGSVNAAQTCSTCHGQIATMTTVKQVRALKMGDCVDCHRQNNAPTDCAICHY